MREIREGGNRCRDSKPKYKIADEDERDKRGGKQMQR